MASSLPPPANHVGGVLETCLYADRLDEAAAFYERVIGLERFAHVLDRHVFFRCGQGVFLLFRPDATDVEDGEVPAHGARGSGHVAFAVPAASLSVWRLAFERHGVPVEREVRWPSGGVSLYVRDPAGNSVELANPGIWGIAEERFFTL